MRRLSAGKLAALILCATSLSTPFATVALADEAAASASQASGQGGDIIVTARKRDERLQDVPVSMTVFSQDDLARYDTTSMAQVAAQTPGLVAGNTASATGGVINLRGIGSATSSATIEQAVSINLDGIQVSQANVLLIGLQDVARIEVLKGPQALFYGKNSPGGVISVISANPGDHFEAKVWSGYEFAADKAFVQGTVSTPLTDTLGVRVAGYYSDQQGYFRNDARPIPSAMIPASLGGGSTSPGVGTTENRGPNEKDIVLRGTLAYASPGGDLKSNLKIAYSRQSRENGLTFGSQVFHCGGDAPTFVTLVGSQGSRDCTLDNTANEADVPTQVAALASMYGDGKTYFRNRQILASWTNEFKPVDALTLTSVTGYYNLREKYLANFTFGSSYFAGNASLMNLSQFSQELRATRLSNLTYGN